MLNHMIVMRAALPQNKLIAIDPLAMRPCDYEPARDTSAAQDSDNHDTKTERDPFAVASPFCNPSL